MSGQQPSKDQKTEKPTHRRIEKAHEKGNVVKSTEVGQALTLALFLGWTALAGHVWMNSLKSQTVNVLSTVGIHHGADVILDRMNAAAMAWFWMLAPFLGLLGIAALAGQYMVTGVHLRKPLVPFEVDKMNPVKGLKNFVNLQKLFEAAKAISRVAIYAALAYFVAVPAWKAVTWVSFGSPAQILAEAARVSGKLLAYALGVGAVLAIIDYAFSKYRWYRQLYMTKQEIRDENKENEGDPHVKGRMRTRQKEAARHRMMASMKDADVVVTNPTHVAVALRYDQARMAAPAVIAKGKGHLAKRIKEKAKQYEIPIVEDPPLARMLERICPVGAPIPESLYRAVAEVFAYVMNSKPGGYRPHEELEREGGDEARR
jgi:flagellar biosynthetic protein FlhB